MMQRAKIQTHSSIPFLAGTLVSEMNENYLSLVIVYTYRLPGKVCFAVVNDSNGLRKAEI